MLDTGVLGEIYQREAGRCIATLIRVLGDVDLAEDAVAEAFAIAARAVARHGTPAEPRRLDHHHRPQPGHRPAAPRVDPRPTATCRPHSLHDAPNPTPMTADLGDVDVVPTTSSG